MKETEAPGRFLDYEGLREIADNGRNWLDWDESETATSAEHIRLRKEAYETFRKSVEKYAETMQKHRQKP